MGGATSRFGVALRVAGLLGAAFALQVPAVVEAQSAPASVVGCYDVEVGMWSAVTDVPATRPRLPPSMGPDSTAYLLPPRIRLSTERGDILSEQGWFRITTPSGVLPTGHRHRSWQMRDDRLLLSYSTGTEGLHGVLVADREGFQGKARTFHDVEGTQLYERDVALRPADCAAPPPLSDTTLRKLPRSVDLDSGLRLTLGGSAPEGVDATPRPSGALALKGRSTGLFAGSDSVAYRIGRNDGNVGVIQLLFSAPAAADSLIARITRAYGEPDPNTGVPGGWWHNRITELSVIPNPRGGFRVLLQDPRSW